MPASFIDDPVHWRRRAEEARTIADQMSDSPSKDAMLRIAKDYEHLAERAEERAKGSHNRDRPFGRGAAPLYLGTPRREAQ
jgi:hypothetical protein